VLKSFTSYFYIKTETVNFLKFISHIHRVISPHNHLGGPSNSASDASVP